MALSCVYGNSECNGCGWCFERQQKKTLNNFIGYKNINTHEIVHIEDALQYAMTECGLMQAVPRDAEAAEQFKTLLLDWYFGSDWLGVYGGDEDA